MEKIGLKTKMLQLERKAILDELIKTGNNKNQAARNLGMNRTTLFMKLERLGLEAFILEPTKKAKKRARK